MSAYVRKTEGVRREPGGLMCAVLVLVGDGYQHSTEIARILDISVDNANGALSRLAAARCIKRRISEIPVMWLITEEGSRKIKDEGLWL